MATVVLVNIASGEAKGEFARIELEEIVAIRNCEHVIRFVLRSGYELTARNDSAAVAAEEKWCKARGV
jgi:hypothetical protein